MTILGDRGDLEVAGPGPDAPTLDRLAASNPGSLLNGFAVFPGVEGVTIEGFRIVNFDGDPTPGSPPRAMGIHVSWDPTVFPGSPQVGNADLAFRYNYFTNIGWTALFMFNSGSRYIRNVSIQYNVVEHDNWDFDDNVYGIECTNCIGADISFNEVSGGFIGILITAQSPPNDVSSIGPYSIANNTVSNTFAMGLNVLSYPINGGSGNTSLDQLQIENNTFNVNFMRDPFGFNDAGRAIGIYPLSGGDLGSFDISGNTINLDLTDPTGDPNANIANGAAYATNGLPLVGVRDVAGSSSFRNNTYAISGPATDVPAPLFEIRDTGGATPQNWTITDNTFDTSGLILDTGFTGGGIKITDPLADGSQLDISNNRFNELPTGILYAAGTTDGVTVDISGRDNTFTATNASYAAFDVDAALNSGLFANQTTFDFNGNFFSLAGDITFPAAALPQVAQRIKSAEGYAFFDPIDDISLIRRQGASVSENWTLTIEDHTAGTVLGTVTVTNGSAAFAGGATGAGGGVLLTFAASPGGAPTIELGDLLEVSFAGQTYDIFLPPSDQVDYTDGIAFWLGSSNNTFFACEAADRSCIEGDAAFTANLNDVFSARADEFIAQDTAEFNVPLSATLGSDFNYLGVAAGNARLNNARALYDELNDQFGTNVVRTISRFNVLSQSFSQYVRVPFETGNFTIEVSDVYRIEVIDDLFASFYGAVPASGTQTFDLITTQSTNINWLTVPLFKTDIANAAELVMDIEATSGTADAVATASRWNRTSQTFVEYIPSFDIGNHTLAPGASVRLDMLQDASYTPVAP